MASLTGYQFLDLIRAKAEISRILSYLRGISKGSLDFPSVVADLLDPKSKSEFKLTISRRPVGPPRTKTLERMNIGEAVAELYNDGQSGLSIEEASAAIAEKFGVNEDHARRCYRDYKKTMDILDQIARDEAP